MSINHPVDPTSYFYAVCLTHGCGGETLFLGPDELAEYNADPDGYAARHFSLSVDEYRDWLTLSGTALCGERTKSGHLCRNSISRIQLSHAEWRERHRSGPCTTHGRRA